MTNVSELTREMIADYEAMVGRKLTPQEYLQFRNQAMIELQNGFAATVNTTMISSQSYTPFSYPISTPQFVSPTPMPQNDVTVVAASISTPENVANEPVREIVANEPTHNVATKESVSEVVTVEIETPATMDTEDEPISPFFALIDRIEA